MNTVQHLYGEFTRREMKVIDLIKASNSNRQIAEALSISQRTVENYISKIYFKTGFPPKRKSASCKPANFRTHPCVNAPHSCAKPTVSYIIPVKEKTMLETQTMTIEEKLAISNKACLLLQAGDKEGYSRLTRTIPMPPFLAKVMKEKVGVEFFRDGNWNLSEAEAEFGTDWLSK